MNSLLEEFLLELNIDGGTNYANSTGNDAQDDIDAADASTTDTTNIDNTGETDQNDNQTDDDIDAADNDTQQNETDDQNSEDDIDAADNTDDYQDDGGNDQNQDNNQQQNDSGNGEVNTVENELSEDEKKAESDIYESLSDEEKMIRIIQLKAKFAQLHEDAESYIESINRINKNEQNILPIRRIIVTLGKVKLYIVDYLENVFNSTSYIDNFTNYIKFLVVFRSIGKVMNNLSENDK